MNSRRTKLLLVGAASLVLAVLTTLALRYAWTGEPDGAAVSLARTHHDRAAVTPAAADHTSPASDAPAAATASCGDACSGATGAATSTSDASDACGSGASATTVAGSTACADVPGAARRMACSRGTEADAAVGLTAFATSKVSANHPAVALAGGGSRVMDPPSGTGSLANRTFKLLPYDPTTW